MATCCYLGMPCTRLASITSHSQPRKCTLPILSKNETPGEGSTSGKEDSLPLSLSLSLSFSLFFSLKSEEARVKARESIRERTRAREREGRSERQGARAKERVVKSEEARDTELPWQPVGMFEPHSRAGIRLTDTSLEPPNLWSVRENGPTVIHLAYQPAHKVPISLCCRISK